VPRPPPARRVAIKTENYKYSRDRAVVAARADAEQIEVSRATLSRVCVVCESVCRRRCVERGGWAATFHFTDDAR